MQDVEYLSNKGYLKADSKILDIGSQNLHNLTPQRARRFIEKYQAILDEEYFEKEVERLTYYSTPRPGERMTYLSELLDLTPIKYTSFDICAAEKTEIFDSNWECIPDKYYGYFDLILNFGTTEHIINQMNCMKVIHEAVAVGGVMVHQLPGTGWAGHGYFCYQAEFFRDLAKANEYEILDLWYIPTGECWFDSLQVDVRDDMRPEEPHSANFDANRRFAPSYNLNVVMRKRTDRPFRLALELATSHARISGEMLGRYRLNPSEGISGGAQANQLAVEATHRTAGVIEDILRWMQFLPEADGDAADDGNSGGTTLSAAHFYELGAAARDAGYADVAFRHFAHANSLIPRHSPTRDALKAMSGDCLAALEGCEEIEERISRLVRAIEMDPWNRDARRTLADLLSARQSEPDLTQMCFVFHDGERAKQIHAEAYKKAIEFITLGGIVGDVLEFGVLGGWSARLFAEAMRDALNLNNLHLFDSFDGLPDYASLVDRRSYEIAGRNIWSDKMRFPKEFLETFSQPHPHHIHDRLSEVIRRERIFIHQGYFATTLPNWDSESSKAALIHMDCDLYQSTVEVLGHLFLKNVLQDGCVLLFDDWNCNRANPDYGQRRAFREFLQRQTRFTASFWYSYGFNGAVYILHEIEARSENGRPAGLLTTTHAEKERSEAPLAVAHSESRRLNALLGVARSENERLEEQYRTARSENERLEARHHEASAEIARLSSCTRDVQAEKEMLDAANRRLEEALSEARTALASMAAERDDASLNLAEVAARLRQIETSTTWRVSAPFRGIGGRFRIR